MIYSSALVPEQKGASALFCPVVTEVMLSKYLNLIRCYSHSLRFQLFHNAKSTAIHRVLRCFSISFYAIYFLSSFVFKPQTSTRAFLPLKFSTVLYINTILVTLLLAFKSIIRLSPSSLIVELIFMSSFSPSA